MGRHPMSEQSGDECMAREEEEDASVFGYTSTLRAYIRVIEGNAVASGCMSVRASKRIAICVSPR